MKRLLAFTLSVILALSAVCALAASLSETREERKARLSAISKQCADRTNRLFDFSDEARRASDCLRIGSLRDDLIRCVAERGSLLRDVTCHHRWIDSAKGTKFCERCGVYAVKHVNGEWLLVCRDSVWLGKEPLDYPKDYGLK